MDKRQKMTGKGSPMTHKGTEIKGSKLKMTDVDLALAYSDNSPVKKTKLQSTKSSVVDVTNGFETAWAEAVEEINGLFSKFSEVLRERAAMDAAQVEQLESVLSEALCLESQLKEKKEHLRRSLAIISDKLQG
uniref:Si:dkey-40g16.5 n=2 Tax=Astyanax mexicanus TaxID=7994 RepID=A0A8B9H8G2_ASTMX